MSRKKIVDIKTDEESPDDDVVFLSENNTNRASKKNRGQIYSFKGWLALLIIATIAGTAFIGFSLMDAEVKIWPVISQETIEVEAIIDANINKLDLASKENAIPGHSLEETQRLSEQFDSTGTVFKETKAGGTIRVYNNYHLTQILVATTRFLSPDDQLFRSKEQVSIPAGSFADVEVLADKLGPEYNIGASTFSIPGLVGSPRYTAVYGKSSEPMTGGAKQEVSVVTKQDLENAEEQLREKLSLVLEEKIRQKAAAQGLVLAEGSFSQDLLEVSSLAPAGTEIDEFNLSIKTNGRALAFEEKDLDELSKHKLYQQTNEDKKLITSSLKHNYQVKSVDLENEKITINLTVSAQSYSNINSTLIKDSIVGQDLKNAWQILREDPRIATAQINLWGFWKSRLPAKDSKIEIGIVLDQIK